MELYDDASEEDLEVIRENECESSVGSLCTKRYRRLFNEIDTLKQAQSELLSTLRKRVEGLKCNKLGASCLVGKRQVLNLLDKPK